MDKMEYLCTMRDGKKVYFDSVTSHFATHLSDAPQLLDLVKAFLKSQDFSDQEKLIEYDAGRIVGDTDLVETAEKDEIIYAKRINRETYTRFVKNRTSIPSTYITMFLKQGELGNYELVSAWVGRDCPPFPDAPNATSESRDFWAKHALVWGAQKIQKGTETSTSPW